MIYLFEDRADDDLPKLFMHSLSDSIKKTIEYTNGNGNLVARAEALLDAGQSVVVILDTVPANKSIRDIYVSLRRLSRQHEYRLVVWNIICAEYYFIKRFGLDNQLSAFRNDVGYDVVVSLKPYKESELIKTDEDRAFTKTFEKYCKLYLLKNGNECIGTGSYFFNADCDCDKGCEEETLSFKSDTYRRAYDFELNGSFDDKVWEIHRKLLTIVNSAIETYNLAGYFNVKEYPAIKQ